MDKLEEEDLYTPIEKALPELWRRWNDVSLRTKVHNHLGYRHKFLRDKPKSILGRFIATPNYELLYFLETARRINLEPVVTELLNDKFCTRNSDKLSLIHMPFYKGINKNNVTSFQYLNVGDCTKAQGRYLCDIQTYNNESLVDFHHKLLDLSILDVISPLIITDISYISSSGDPRLFYLRFLPLFICHGIYFENFITNKQERVFFNTVILPAFTEIKEFFGIKPLIVRLLPDYKASDIFWCCYPYELRNNILQTSHKESPI